MMTLVSKPAELTPAFKQDGLLWVFKDSASYSAIGADGGNTEIGGISTAMTNTLSAGDLVYVTGMAGVAFVDSAVVEIISVSTGTIVVDIQYSADFSTGEIRVIRQATFNVEAGYDLAIFVNQSRIQTTVRPSPQGLYEINPKSFVISKYNQRVLTVGQRVNDHNTPVYVYPDGEAQANLATALCALSATPAQGIIYTDASNQNKYNVITVKKYNYIDDAGDKNNQAPGSFELTYLRGKVYEFDFSAPILDVNTTITPQPQTTDYFELITANSGQDILGFKILTQHIPAGTSVIYPAFSNTMGSDYDININIIDTIDVRPECTGLHVFWWHPNGGWVSYIFTSAISKGQTQGSPELHERKFTIQAVDYDTQQEIIEVTAKPESQAIYDYLTSLYQSNEILTKDANGDYKRYYLKQVGGAIKSTTPFKPASNRLSFTLLSEQAINRIYD